MLKVYFMTEKSEVLSKFKEFEKMFSNEAVSANSVWKTPPLTGDVAAHLSDYSIHTWSQSADSLL